MKIDKNKVRIHFERAAQTYDKEATVQQQMGELLLFLLDDHLSAPPDFVLEVGCCTGNLTRMLVDRFPEIKVLHVNDLVEKFDNEIMNIDLSGDLIFLSGDIEKIRLPQKYQLILSSSTFHWLHDLRAFFEKIKRYLLPGGTLAFTLYGPKNLREIRTLTGTGLDYFSLEEVVHLLELNFEVLVAQQSIQTITFADPYAVLQHFQQTGINALTQGGWSRGKLRSFIKRYQQRFKASKGVSLTYHPMYFLARPLTIKTN